jgi:hypothetical protein
MMKVRVIKPIRPLGRYRVGYVLEVGGGVADIWLRRGIVELVEDESEVEVATIEPDRNAAVRTGPPKKRKRGRPRKHPLPT